MSPRPSLLLLTLLLALPSTAQAGPDRVLVITEQTLVSATVTLPRVPGQDATQCLQLRDQVTRILARRIHDQYFPTLTDAGEFPLQYACRTTSDQTHLEFVMTVTLSRTPAPTDSLRTVLDGPLR